MELAMGVGFLWSKYMRLTGIMAISFLMCIVPFNIYVALNSIEFGGNVHGPIYLLFRIPLQLFLIGWIWFMAIHPSEPSSLRNM